MSVTKAVILLSAVIFLTFGNCLTNDFIGDTQVLFRENTFYKNSKNLKRLFDQSFIMDPAKFLNAPMKKLSFSGCISYRPVTALSFFLDYAVWKGKPWGHNLDNVLLHVTAVLLLFGLVWLLTANNSLALLAALLFGTHPIQSEVVSNVGYRSDILVTIFALLTLIAYIKGREPGQKWNGAWRAASYVAFVLALFSKETALTLPVIIFLYDYFFRTETKAAPFIVALPATGREERKKGKNERQDLKSGAGEKNQAKINSSVAERFFPFGVFLVILIFYLYIYFFIMVNPYYARPLFADRSLLDQVPAAVKIFYEYLVVLFLPFKTTVLPPLYAPSVAPGIVFEILVVAAALIGAVILAIKSFRIQKIIPFALCWFALTYLPVSNLVPLLNPWAFRFMYLPSVGFFILLAVFIEWGFEKGGEQISPQIASIFKMALVGLFVSLSLPQNKFFQNDITACREMIKNYPDSSQPYWVLGLKYFDAQNYVEARTYLQKYLDLPANNPFISSQKKDFMAQQMLGRSYIDDPEQAVAHFEKALALNPEPVGIYLDLSLANILKKDYSSALKYAALAIEKDNTISAAYVYAIHSYAELGHLPEAQAMLNRVRPLFPDDRQLQALGEHLKEKKAGK